MFTRSVSAAALVATAGLLSATTVARTNDASPGLTAHEWGTFTTVAGVNGTAIDWLPLGGPTDLPCFVEHFQNSSTIKLVGDYNGPLDFDHARAALLGKVRMETPVLYFYGVEDARLDVNVRFPHGLITEWYPHANVTEAIVGPNTLRQNTPPARIEWRDIHVRSGGAATFAATSGESHYYAARATDAAPITVGNQHERFLFYRGIADFDVPVTATALANDRVRIGGGRGHDVPAVVLFERRGASLGFRVLGTVHGDTTVDAPMLNGSLDGLRAQLQQTLVAAGLFPKEAAAMLETWRDSWFEDGVRVFYVVPRTMADDILPLDITPRPVQMARVFVGRMEVITAKTETTVAQAIRADDKVVLAKYARFLGPISDRLMAQASSEAERSRIRTATNTALATYFRKSVACE